MREEIVLETLCFTHSEVVANLHQRAFDENWSAKEFQNLITLPASFGFLALKGGLPIGFVLCQGDDVEAEIITIASDPDCERRGVGTILVQRVFEQTQRLFLEVAEDNIKAMSFYVKQGFETIGKRPRYYNRGNGNRCDALVMQKEVS